MIEYDYKGIKVEATVEMEQHDYVDAGGHCRVRFEKNIKVGVRFWKFLVDGNLTELAFIKSTLNYFMQCYWKRTSKEGSRIELMKTIHHSHKSHFVNPLSLGFMARQKNKKHYLEISLLENGNPAGEVYLDGPEVLMLDIAIGKAISLLAPKMIESEEEKGKEESGEKSGAESSEPKKIPPIQYITSFDC